MVLTCGAVVRVSTKAAGVLAILSSRRSPLVTLAASLSQRHTQSHASCMGAPHEAARTLVRSRTWRWSRIFTPVNSNEHVAFRIRTAN